jgi:hypothetical protein
LNPPRPTRSRRPRPEKGDPLERRMGLDGIPWEIQGNQRKSAIGLWT